MFAYPCQLLEGEGWGEVKYLNTHQPQPPVGTSLLGALPLCADPDSGTL